MTSEKLGSAIQLIKSENKSAAQPILKEILRLTQKMKKPGYTCIFVQKRLARKDISCSKH